MYRIGQLAKKTGLSAHTLRFYEQEQLLMPTERSASGYRLYTDQDLHQALFVARGRDAGFSIDEVRHLLSIRLDKQHHTCEEVTEITRQKLSEVRHKIAELTVIKRGLERMLDVCCGGDEAATDCSILEMLEPEVTGVPGKELSQ